MKKIVSMLAVISIMVAILAGCGAGSGGSDAEYSLTVSGIGGSLNFIPVYIAEQEGWLEEEGLEIDSIMFTNGPVQMESLSSDAWDFGFTGVGGVLSGLIGYDAINVGASGTDDGTQYVFARNDSAIVQAGTGNNSIDEDIYGDAESWEGVNVLANTGTVLQYLLNRTLEGFDLESGAVQFTAMDAPTAYSAFLAGEGDVVVLTGSSGTFNLLNDSENYTAISSGTMAETGLMTNFIANSNSYEDPEKYEAMKILLKVYFESAQWIMDNPDEAAVYMRDFAEENGIDMDEETIKRYLEADQYYSLEEAYELITTDAEDSDVSIMEQRIAEVLDFFIEHGNYQAEDEENFKGKTDPKLLTEIYEEAE
ncbi:ABC transporter substrate-binding protein [Amphibacillus sp. Q70]|uniref:ABC transporter substrate-binding protein n=1 Tax=Amphibacillus sp. Q70 TaxID=3453416 RepID=UPI003F84D663